MQRLALSVCLIASASACGSSCPECPECAELPVAAGATSDGGALSTTSASSPPAEAGVKDEVLAASLLLNEVYSTRGIEVGNQLRTRLAAAGYQQALAVTQPDPELLERLRQVQTDMRHALGPEIDTADAGARGAESSGEDKPPGEQAEKGVSGQEATLRAFQAEVALTSQAIERLRDGDRNRLFERYKKKLDRTGYLRAFSVAAHRPQAIKALRALRSEVEALIKKRAGDD